MAYIQIAPPLSLFATFPEIINDLLLILNIVSRILIQNAPPSFASLSLIMIDYEASIISSFICPT